ncbi:MAG: sodium:alanine symporter family protein [Clostridia bacterium]|nr:sodium:alanine symporter family protein [Clostridia bacterium]
MEALYNTLNWVDGNILWGIPMIILILVSGIFLSVRSKFFQVRKFGACMEHTVGGTVKQMKKKEKKTDPNAITPFEAFATAVSGTVGTGNIVGVTTAIISGGPGAVFWMWVSAFFGMFTKFAEITLGLYFRKKDNKGEYIGGPMQYIEHGTKQKWLAVLFAIFTILAAIGMGSVQADTIQSTWQTAFSIPTWVTALIIAAITGLVVIGGIQRIGKVSSLVMPVMIIFFIIMTVIMIIINITAVPAAFASIFAGAFSFKSVGSGVMGYVIAQAMRYGFARGIFSNEAGLGSAPIAHATADTKEPVEQGLWGIFEVFIDTFVVCTLTALFVLTSGLVGADGFGSAAQVAMGAFTKTFGTIGTVAYSIILPLFAFSTVLAWAVYGAKASQYLFKKHQNGAKLAFNIIYLAMIVGVSLLTFFFGDNLGADFVWLISDMTNALMAIPNLIALFILSGLLVKIIKNYYARKNGADLAPMLSAYDED